MDAEKYVQARLELIHRNSTYGLLNKALPPIDQDMDKIPDSVETYISDSIHKITKLVDETEDAFIFEHISSYVNGVMQHEGITKIPKRLLERALVCFKEEHKEEWDVLMGIEENKEEATDEEIQEILGKNGE